MNAELNPDQKLDISSVRPERRRVSASDRDPATGRLMPPARPAPSLLKPLAPPRLGRLRPMTTADAENTKGRKYLLKKWLYAGEFSVWWGEAKAGKSFLVLDIAYALAQGRSVLGAKARKCAVIYVAAEGEGGIGGRIKALVDKHGHAENFVFIAQPVDFLEDDGDTEALIGLGRDLLTRCRARNGEDVELVIVIDTMHRASPGMEENSARDTGRFVRNVDAIRFQTGAHVVAVHHSGGDTTKMRGSTAVVGALDLEVKVEVDASTGIRTAKVMRAKDDEGGANVRYRLERAPLPPDEDGDPRNTCIVAYIEGVVLTSADDAKAKLSPQNRKALTFLADVVHERGEDHPGSHYIPTGTRTVTLDQWAEHCAEHGLTDATSDDSKMAIFRKMRRELVTANAIAVVGDHVWPVAKPVEAPRGIS